MTRNTDIGPYGNNDWNENNLNTLATNNWRASLVPAAAVIPAPIAYIKVVVVKKLVVEFGKIVTLDLDQVKYSFNFFHLVYIFLKYIYYFTLKKLECSKQAYCT